MTRLSAGHAACSTHGAGGVGVRLSSEVSHPFTVAQYVATLVTHGSDDYVVGPRSGRESDTSA